MTIRTPAWRATFCLLISGASLAGQFTLSGCGDSRPKVFVPENPAPRPDPNARLRRPEAAPQTPGQPARPAGQ